MENKIIKRLNKTTHSLDNEDSDHTDHNLFTSPGILKRRPYISTTKKRHSAFPKKNVQLPKKIIDTFVEKETIDQLIDAETGENISFSLAKWNSIEGRLNMDNKTVVEMGTGKLYISSNYYRKETENNTYHPIVKTFLSKGPLKNMFHTHWNKRSDTIDYHLMEDKGIEISPTKSLEVIDDVKNELVVSQLQEVMNTSRDNRLVLPPIVATPPSPSLEVVKTKEERHPGYKFNLYHQLIFLFV